MGLFRPDYNRPGPGVRKDEPRKKGTRRFLEILSRSLSDLVKLNILFCVCALPSVAVFILGFAGFYTTAAFLISLILAFPVGGAAVALVYCISKMLRDDPGFVWPDFKRKFLENIKQAAGPGIIFIAMIYSQVLLWYGYLFGGTNVDFAWPLMMFILFLLIGMFMPYIFLLFAYIDLKASQTIKNGILLSLANMPRSFMGAVMGGVLWAAFFMFMTVSILFIPLIVIIGFSLTWLLTLMWVWPPVDKQFAIETTIRNRQSGANQEPAG